MDENEAEIEVPPWPSAKLGLELGEDLVGYLEICMRAGIQRPTVTHWRKAGLKQGWLRPFPEPVAELKIGPIWWWPDVEAWLKETGRQTDAGWSHEQVTASSTSGPFRQKRVWVQEEG